MKIPKSLYRAESSYRPENSQKLRYITQEFHSAKKEVEDGFKNINIKPLALDKISTQDNFYVKNKDLMTPILTPTTGPTLSNKSGIMKSTGSNFLGSTRPETRLLPSEGGSFGQLLIEDSLMDT